MVGLISFIYCYKTMEMNFPTSVTLSILMTTQEAFVDSVGQDQTAQNVHFLI